MRLKLVGLVQRLLYSSCEPSELSQWLCSYDDSTINIVVIIIIIIIILSANICWSSNRGFTVSGARYLKVEVDEQDIQSKDNAVTEMYVTVLERFHTALRKVSVFITSYHIVSYRIVSYRIVSYTFIVRTVSKLEQTILS